MLTVRSTPRAGAERTGQRSHDPAGFHSDRDQRPRRVDLFVAERPEKQMLDLDLTVAAFPSLSCRCRKHPPESGAGPS